MTDQQIAELGGAFARYLGRFRGCFVKGRIAAHFDTYCRGLLNDLPRKSVEPITLASGIAARIPSRWRSVTSPTREPLLGDLAREGGKEGEAERWRRKGVRSR